MHCICKLFYSILQYFNVLYILYGHIWSIWFLIFPNDWLKHRHKRCVATTQDDWDAYSGLVEEMGKSVQIVGDDLFFGQKEILPSTAKHSYCCTGNNC